MDLEALRVNWTPIGSQLFCLRARFHGKLCLLFFSQLVANQFREVFRELQDRLKKQARLTSLEVRAAANFLSLTRFRQSLFFCSVHMVSDES